MCDINNLSIGDYLVANTEFNSNELFKIERKGFNGELYDTKWRKLHTTNFRLATPQEIQLNKRLP